MTPEYVRRTATKLLIIEKLRKQSLMNHEKSEFEILFSEKLTENGDLSFNFI